MLMKQAWVFGPILAEYLLVLKQVIKEIDP